MWPVMVMKGIANAINLLICINSNAGVLPILIMIMELRHWYITAKTR
jgi:hypothetical protein